MRPVTVKQARLQKSKFNKVLNVLLFFGKNFLWKLLKTKRVLACSNVHFIMMKTSTLSLILTIKTPYYIILL